MGTGIELVGVAEWPTLGRCNCQGLGRKRRLLVFGARGLHLRIVTQLGKQSCCADCQNRERQPWLPHGEKHTSCLAQVCVAERTSVCTKSSPLKSSGSRLTRARA